MRSCWRKSGCSPLSTTTRGAPPAARGSARTSTAAKARIGVNPTSQEQPGRRVSVQTEPARLRVRRTAAELQEGPLMAHTFRFFRAGGFDQVRLDTGADLMALDQLDQKLWVALACPTDSVDFDQ